MAGENIGLIKVPLLAVALSLLHKANEDVKLSNDSSRTFDVV